MFECDAVHPNDGHMVFIEGALQYSRKRWDDKLFREPLHEDSPLREKNGRLLLAILVKCISDDPSLTPADVISAERALHQFDCDRVR